MAGGLIGCRGFRAFITSGAPDALTLAAHLTAAFALAYAGADISEGGK